MFTLATHTFLITPLQIFQYCNTCISPFIEILPGFLHVEFWMNRVDPCPSAPCASSENESIDEQEEKEQEEKSGEGELRDL